MQGIKMGDWQFEKKVSIGDLVALAMALVAIIYAYSTLDKRLAVLEAVASQQVVNDT